MKKLIKNLLTKYNHWAIKRILKKSISKPCPSFHMRNFMGNAYKKYLFDYNILTEEEKEKLNDPEVKAYYAWAKRNKKGQW
uniref:Uncharacterized protein n=1 Tax=viral metagenome TaxID=1070528 RepID=A0A6H1ZDC1_9ZZZZ